MKIHFITLFPKALSSYFETSIMKKAQESGAFQLHVYNLADFSVKNTRRADDRPYGGFPGTILAPEPLEKAIEHAQSTDSEPIAWCYPDARGEVLKQAKLAEMSQKTSIGFLCGHYEGIDERVLEHYGVTSIALGEYVLTSGELASTVIIDGLVRLIPGVLSEESLLEESFSPGTEGKREYPHYTRPETWQGHVVPPELLSGNHKTIELWKKNHLH